MLQGLDQPSKEFRHAATADPDRLLAGGPRTRREFGADHRTRPEAGETVLFEGPPGQDLFLAGNRVSVAASVGGLAHGGFKVQVQRLI